MASTPDTSFSSEELDQRGRKFKPKAPIPTPSKLPSPSSETEEGSDCASEDTREAIKYAYQAIWNSFCGQPAAKNTSFKLRSQRNYETLYHQLSEHPGLQEHFEEEIRKDWDTTSGMLTLRFMASPLHGFFEELITDAINKELDRVSQNFPALQPFRRKIASGGTSRIQKRRRTSRVPELDKSPDGQWHYRGSRYPAFVLEIAYRQDEENLLDKVKEFFARLQGGISSVLGFDITYPKGERRSAFTHDASFTLWTSRQEGSRLRVKTTVQGQAFRTDGRAVLGDLILPFELFVPSKDHYLLAPYLEPGTDVRIPFAKLCNLLEEAERRQNDMEATASPSPPSEGQQGIKRVTFEDKDGTLTWDLQVPVPKRQRIDDADVPLGRTRSQTRSRTRLQAHSTSRTRRSSRLQGRGTCSGNDPPTS